MALNKFLAGFALMTGALASVLFAVTVTGTVNSFASGELISASLVNQNFASLKTAIETVKEPPIGTIMAWHRDLTGVPSLPDGWVVCDGLPISDADSPMNGQNTPNLNSPPFGWNSDGAFLRGSTSSGGGFHQDQLQAHRHHRNIHNQPEHDIRFGATGGPSSMPPGGFHNANIATTGDASSGRIGGETRPVYFRVIYIMRIK